MNEINNYFGIDETLNIRYLDKKSQQPIIDLLADFYMKIRSIISGYGSKAAECNAYYDSKSTIVMFKNNDFMGFLGFMGTISHEYGHFIDKKYPDLGSLGAQISAYSEPIYSLIEHESNPTEVSSYRISYIVMDKLTKVLAEQAIKKPALYVKALKTLMSYTETQLAGLRVKYKKSFAAMDSAYQEYADLKERYCLEQNPNYEQLPHDQITEIILNANQNPKVKALYEKYKQARAKIPHEYATLKMDLDHYDRLLKAYNDSPQRFQELFSVMSM